MTDNKFNLDNTYQYFLSEHDHNLHCIRPFVGIINNYDKILSILHNQLIKTLYNSRMDTVQSIQNLTKTTHRHYIMDKNIIQQLGDLVNDELKLKIDKLPFVPEEIILCDEICSILNYNESCEPEVFKYSYYEGIERKYNGWILGTFLLCLNSNIKNNNGRLITNSPSLAWSIDKHNTDFTFMSISEQKEGSLQSQGGPERSKLKKLTYHIFDQLTKTTQYIFLLDENTFHKYIPVYNDECILILRLHFWLKMPTIKCNLLKYDMYSIDCPLAKFRDIPKGPCLLCQQWKIEANNFVIILNKIILNVNTNILNIIAEYLINKRSECICERNTSCACTCFKCLKDCLAGTRSEVPTYYYTFLGDD
jgi:hypothetical protein